MHYGNVYAQRLTAAFMAIVLTLLVGCAGSVQPETPRQALYTAYGQAEAVMDTANRLHRNGTISDAQHGDVLDRVSSVYDTLQRAEAMLEAGDTSSAEGRIDAANHSLIAVRNSLQEAQNE